MDNVQCGVFIVHTLFGILSPIFVHCYIQRAPFLTSQHRPGELVVVGSGNNARTPQNEILLPSVTPPSHPNIFVVPTVTPTVLPTVIPITIPRSPWYHAFGGQNPPNDARLYHVLRKRVNNFSAAPQSANLIQTRQVDNGQGNSFIMVQNIKNTITSESANDAMNFKRLMEQNQRNNSPEESHRNNQNENHISPWKRSISRQIQELKQRFSAADIHSLQQQQQRNMMAQLLQQHQQLQQQQQQQHQLQEQQQPQLIQQQQHTSTYHDQEDQPTILQDSGKTESDSLTTPAEDMPQNFPAASIDETFASMVAQSGKSMSFSSDIGPGVYKVEYDILLGKDEMRQKYSSSSEAESNRKKRALVKNVDSRWTDGKIPYEIAVHDFSSNDLRMIREALRQWESFTCVRFEPTRHSDRHSLLIKDSDGCHSFVGMKRKHQMVGLNRACRKKSIILHEIGHAIGMFHEQARPDRDEYINIIKANILPPVRFNFQKIDPSQTTNHSIPYDYLSVMHYGETAFSSDVGKITMQTKDTAYQKRIGKATRLSFKDVWAVNAMYNCSGHCIAPPVCPGNDSFVGKDCKCWCPTKEGDRTFSQEPAKHCEELPVDIPRQHLQITDHVMGPEIELRPIAFGPDRLQELGLSRHRVGHAILTPVGHVSTWRGSTTSSSLSNTERLGDKLSPTVSDTGALRPDSNGQSSNNSKLNKSLRVLIRDFLFSHGAALRKHRKLISPYSANEEVSTAQLESLLKTIQKINKEPQNPVVESSHLASNQPASNSIMKDIAALLPQQQTRRNRQLRRISSQPLTLRPSSISFESATVSRDPSSQNNVGQLTPIKENTRRMHSQIPFI